MKYFLLICVLFITSQAAPVIELNKITRQQDDQAIILQYDNTNDGNGNYEFSFETSNGFRRGESGTLVNIGQPDEHIEVQGYFSYTDSDGRSVVIRYTADENGYHVNPDLPPSVITVASSPLNPALVATLLGG